MTTATTALPVQAVRPEAALMGAVTEEFLQLIGWDPAVRIVTFPRSHPLLGSRICPVKGCEKMAYTSRERTLCRGCETKMKESGQSLDEFVATAKHNWRSTGTSPCQVPGCARPRRTIRQALCDAHCYQQQKIHRVTIEEFLLRPDLQPFESLGPCAVAACYRDRGNGDYCPPHRQARNLLRRTGWLEGEELWRRTAPAVVEHGVVSLRGLPDLVVAEVLFCLQDRNAKGVKQRDQDLRPFVDAVRAQQLSSIRDFDLGAMKDRAKRLAVGFLKHLARFGLSPETERHKDTWDGAAFGLGKGFLHFENISQRWLRKATQQWAIDDLPRRRGKNPLPPVQRQINSIAMLSKSLRLNRDDEGSDPRILRRDDIVLFLNRLLFLQLQGEISALHRYWDARDIRRLLARMRTLGLTQPGQPLHGLPDNFALREEDVPEYDEDDDAGRDLPVEVMRQLCQHLDSLDPDGHQLSRTATELLIDTGRRPDEICSLPLDCLGRDGDGKPELIYDNHKSLRKARRLPIAEATAALIIAQQERTRARFPNTPRKELVLLPSPVANPNGTKAINSDSVGDVHRAWVSSLPEILVPVVVDEDGKRVKKMLPFDKSKIYLYAYRHTYAQRHADTNVAPDVLRVLMDHRRLDTTQRYYRVSDKRRREAVNRVTAMQFDRKGNRIWRQVETLLESEHARRGVGEVQVPYGICTEPTNVSAGGDDCPVRFRCVGCEHFRTDVSYLPDLEAYLADLLRGRERLAAFAADSWAKTEAMPSDEEITRVRRLVKRVREQLEDRTEEDRMQIQEAVTVVRRSRRVVSLGMPRVRPELPDYRGGRSAE
ncbi:site-specific integrase [Streptomyces sp. NBC_00154]|uniref:tyrosine-type recombinase/integrase n=1 Tax=Streptomyces sp. NBC_00154 TaxID=2975670 RepID=UPI00224D11E3|nr:site-specific integrase [Streptomyces sp. NBC_00154]MCX5317980.1 site-specific integrase [Streptomyces sp. NBC_00154]